MSAFATHLRDGGFLRDGVSKDEARDVLWTHNSVELWDLLVRQRGSSNPRFGRWIGRQLIAALLSTHHNSDPTQAQGDHALARSAVSGRWV